MEVLLDLNVFNVSFSELTLGKEGEKFIKEQLSDLELIEWDACGRLLFKMGWHNQHNFFFNLEIFNGESSASFICFAFCAEYIVK